MEKTEIQCKEEQDYKEFLTEWVQEKNEEVDNLNKKLNIQNNLLQALRSKNKNEEIVKFTKQLEEEIEERVDDISNLKVKLQSQHEMIEYLIVQNKNKEEQIYSLVDERKEYKKEKKYLKSRIEHLLSEDNNGENKEGILKSE